MYESQVSFRNDVSKAIYHDAKGMYVGREDKERAHRSSSFCVCEFLSTADFGKIADDDDQIRLTPAIVTD